MRLAFLLLLIVAGAACADEPPQLECSGREQGTGASGTSRSFKITGDLSESQHTDGVWNLRGMIELGSGPSAIHVPVTGGYHERPEGGFELIAGSQSNKLLGGLRITVMPGHEVLTRRGTTAVVMAAGQTVETGTPAEVTCRIVEG